MSELRDVGRRFISLLLAIVMVVSLMPYGAVTAYASVSGSFDGTLDKLEVTSDDTNATWTKNGTEVSASVAGGKDSCNNDEARSSTLTLKNKNLGGAKLSFNYTIVKNTGSVVINGTTVTANGTVEKYQLDKDGTYTIKITSGKGSANATEIKITNLILEADPIPVTTTFLPATNGTYTVNGVEVTTETLRKNHYASDKQTLVAIPASGYRLLGWYNGSTGAYFSSTTTVTYETIESHNIYPMFTAAGNAVFGVGDQYFGNLTEAVNYANGASEKTIVLLESGTVTGEHTIYSGITLLIPYDAAHTLKTTAPVCAGTAWTQPTPFVTLTMAANAKITIEGAVCVGGQHSSGGGSTDFGTAPTGPCGFINMGSNSQIVLESGGALYAWGFITGSGSVTAKNGSTVYEGFQIADFRGGDATSAMAKHNLVDSGEGMFPFSQYYVQNVEVLENFHYGAKMNVYTSVNIARQNISMPVEFIGGSGAMFVPTSENTVVTKQYLPGRDRLHMTVAGDMSLSSLVINFPSEYAGALLIAGIPQSIDSSKFVLPINNNFVIDILSGATTISQDLALLAGNELTIAQGANVIVSENTNLYVYDKAVWESGNFVHSKTEKTFAPVKYTPTRTYTRTSANDIKDAMIDISGTLTINGAVYTTENGANLISVGETGRVVFNAAAPADAVTYQPTQNGTAITANEIPVTSAQLHNNETKNPDLPYTQTANAAAGSLFGWHQRLDKWIKMQAVNITYHDNDGDDNTEEITATQKVENVDDVVALAGINLYRADNEALSNFKKTGHHIESWQYKVDDVEETYAPGDVVPVVNDATKKAEFITDTDLYAVWAKNIYKITFQDETGKELKVLESQDETGFETAIDLNKLAQEHLTRDGYTIQSWTVEAAMDDGTTKTWNVTVGEDGTATVTSENGELPTFMPAGNITVKAAAENGWQANTYTVAYNANADKFEGTMESTTHTYDVEASLCENTFTRTGYTFTGWNTQADGTGESYTDQANVENLTTENGATVTLYAQWDANEYTVKYAANADDAGGTTADSTHVYDKEAALTANGFKRTGYTFTGWNTLADGTGTAYTDKAEVSNLTTTNGATVTLYAQWKIKQYTITFDSNGGSSVDNITADYNAEISAPAAPEKTGYSFQYWAKAGDTSEIPAEVAFPDKMPLNGLNLKAVWEINTWTVTWDTGDAATTTNPTYTYGATITKPADPTKDGHTFLSWTGYTDGMTMPDNDVTFTAQWEISKNTITWYDSDRTKVLDTTENVAYGTVINGTGENDVKLPTVTKEGHSFNKWYDAKGYPVFGNGATETMPDTDVSYYASWNVNSYAITWVTDHGTVPKVSNAEYGKPLSDFETNLTETGYTFTGWVYTKTEDGSAYAEDTMPAFALTATAQWTTNEHTITWDANGHGNASAAQTVAFGTNLSTLEQKLTAEGYTQNEDGWKYYDASGKEYTGTTMPNYDLTAKAQWTINSHKVTWTVDDQTEEQTYNFGATIVPPSYTKEGHTLNWNTTVPETMPDNDLAFTGTWTVNSYTLTWNWDVNDAEDKPITTTETVAYGTQITSRTGGATKEGYTHAGWYGTDGNTVVFPITMPAKNLILKAKWDWNQYTITWITDNGEEAKTTTVYHGQTPSYGDTNPSKAKTDEFTYTFTGWTPEVAEATQNATYTAVYSAEKNKYTIKWVDWDGTELTTCSMEYGGMPVYPGESDPSRADTDVNTYTFSGWEPEVTAVTGEATYKAKYEAAERLYTITWNVGGQTSTTQHKYGETPSVADPTKAETAEYTYQFAGWEPEVVSVTENAEYTATFKEVPKGYTVTWMADGKQHEQQKVAFGSEIPTVADPEKEGHTFTGWTVDAGEVPTTMPAQNVTLMAAFEKNSYNIKWLIGEEEYQPDGAVNSVPYGETITLPTAPSKEGYTFSGWSYAKQTDNSAYTGTTMPASDLTATAQWTPIDYTITFNSDGGSAVNPITAGYETSVNAPDAPTKTGHTFDGWVNESNEKVTFPVIMPLNGVTLTAVWTVNAYTITFDTDGGSEVSEIKAAYMSEVQAPAAPSKEGYTFSHWAEADGTTVNFPVTMPVDGMKLKAVWTANEYTITFDTGDGGSEVATITAKYKEAISKPADPTRTGYTFQHWALAADEANTKVEFPAAMPLDGMNLKAVWKINTYTVTWNVEGETSTESYDYGSTPSYKGTPTKAATPEYTYEFSCWKDANNQELAVLPNVTGDVTYTAVFKEIANKYQIIWDGDESKRTEIAYGESLPTNEVSKEGYTFDGWKYTYVVTSEDEDGKEVTETLEYTEKTMPAHDLMATSQWTINQYTITFDFAGGTTDDGSATAEVITKDYSADLSNVQAPTVTRTGYTFVKWDGTLPQTMPAEHIIIKAIWQINEGTISFLDDDKTTELGTFSGEYGDSVIAPQNLEKNGYTFDCWTDADGNEVAVPEKMPAESMVLYAKWTANTYKVTFNGNGGAFADGTTTSVEKTLTFNQANDLTSLGVNNFQRTGYTLKGWARSADAMVAEFGTETYTHTTAGDLTLYAVWEAKEYTITFADGYSETPVQTGKQTYGEAMQKPEDPEREGYTFNGWTPDVPENVPVEDQTYTATWTKNKYNVTWVVDGETYSISENVEFEAAIIKPKDPEKTGHTFAGWSPEVPATMPAGNQTFTATWTVNNYRITWMADDQEVKSEELAYGADIPTNVAAPDKTGHTFTAWEGYPEGMKVPAYPVTLIAKYTPNNYTITWTADGKTVDSKTLPYGTTIENPTAPEKTGHSFKGWEGYTDGMTVPAGDVELKAIYEANKYALTWNANGHGENRTDQVTFGENLKNLETVLKDTGYTHDGGWSYTYSGTDGEILTYEGDTMPAFALTATAQWTINTYTVTWVNDVLDEDGKKIVLETDADVSYNTKPTFDGAAPTKEKTAQYTYSFSGWVDENQNVLTENTVVTGDVTYTATYTSTVNKYTVTFINDDGTPLQSGEWEYGAMPVYTGANPTKAKDQEYTYTFNGWDQQLAEVTGDVTYKAVYSSTVNTYLVRWIDENGKVLEMDTVAYGTVPVFNGTEPTKPATAQYTYAFTGWTPAVTEITGAVDYRPTFSSTVNKYLVTWVDEDGTTVLDQQSVEYGQVPVYGGETPTKDGDAQYSYAFSGWTPEVKAVTGTATYQATYQQSTNTYKVTWYHADGQVLETDPAVPYGTAPSYNGENPTKTEDVEYAYVFAGWTPEITENTVITGETSYTAVFEKIQREYTVSLESGTDDITLIGQKAKYNETIELDVMSRAGYTFHGWATKKDAAAEECINGTYTVKGDVTLYAIWTVNSYDIAILDGYSEVPIYQATLNYGAAVPAQAAPVREGYIFTGWVDGENNKVEIPTTMPAKHTTIKASWEINQYTITFVTGEGGTEISSITENYGTPITAPADPVRTGYDFTGWDKTIPATMPAGDMTITAKWEIHEYTITWDTDGDGVVDETTYVKYQQVPEYAKGSKEEDAQYVYTFSNWEPAPYAADKDQLYTAQFTTTTKKYTISWDTNGDGRVDDTTSVAYGAMPTHTDGEKTADQQYRYEFAGWKPELAAVTGAATYTATFTSIPVEYTIHFLDWKEGNTVSESITAGYGTGIEMPTTPVKTGHTFAGWVDKEGNPVTIPETMPVGGMTVYATWSVNQYTITFDTDGGTEIGAITDDFGTEVTAPAVPEKTGYTFIGWSPAVPETIPAENITVTAQWKINQYTITFNANGGSAVDAIAQDYNSAVTAPAAPTRDGYTFAGWDKEVPAWMPAENITITAQWTANPYSITFYANAGDAEPYAVVPALCDEAIEVPADPVKEGYNFGYWVDAEGQQVSIPATMPAGGLTVYGYWTINQYTITFDTGKDASTVTPITADYGTDLTVYQIEVPAKTGHTFAGWADEAGNDMTVPATMPAQNLKLVAKWNVNQYSITFNTNGGSPLPTITQDYGTLVDVPANPSREGYSFSGWDKQIPVTMPAENMTITASWSINSYNITFITNSEESPAIEPIKAEYGADLTGCVIENPVRTGYTFTGWSPEFPETMPAGGLTLTAQWKADMYAISWDMNGDGDMDDEVDEITAEAYDSVPDHEDGVKPATAEYTYVFKRWDPKVKAVDGTATYTALFDEIPNEYTITFDSNGGSAVETATYAYGTAVTAPEAPTKAGYTFEGWDALPETMPAENVTVVAQWKAIEYTVSFNTNGGGVIRPITAAYDTPIQKPEDPARTGYTFTGWSPAFPEKMPLGGAALTAQWVINQYTITFEDGQGNVITTITQDYGTPVTKPENPTREDGYTFRDWNTTVPANMPAADMTITALWDYTYTGWKDEEKGTTYLENGEIAYYNQWKEIDGKLYYFNTEGFVVKGVYTTWDVTDSYEATFVFDDTTGQFRQDLNGIYTTGEDTYYVQNGEVISYPGLVRIVKADGEVNYYYFGADGKIVKNGSYKVEQVNDLRLPQDTYTFDENGVIVHHEDTSRNGIHEEDGKKYYYIDGVKVFMGLVEIDGDYYYAAKGGEIIVNRESYYISRTNGLLESGVYAFDEEGRIVFSTEIKNGIYEEDGGLYYYVNNVKTNAGLLYLDGYYYYAAANGEIIAGRSYWISKTNDLLPQGTYTFDEQGRMVDVPGEEHNGDVDGDGDVDEMDAVYLLWHTLFEEMYPISIDADYNDDGQVTDADALKLLWHALFKDEFEL